MIRVPVRATAAAAAAAAAAGAGKLLQSEYGQVTGQKCLHVDRADFLDAGLDDVLGPVLDLNAPIRIVRIIMTLSVGQLVS